MRDGQGETPAQAGLQTGFLPETAMMKRTNVEVIFLVLLGAGLGFASLNFLPNGSTACRSTGRSPTAGGGK
jgi:hypothetical protein